MQAWVWHGAALMAMAASAGVYWVFGPGYHGDTSRAKTPLLPFEVDFMQKFVRNGKEESGFLVRKRGTSGKAQLRLFYRFWLPKTDQIRGVVVVLHGMTSHSSRASSSFCGPLLERGYVVASLDNEGHGRSDGRHGYFNDFNYLVDDAIAFITLAREKFPDQKLFVAGGSLAGLMVLHLLLKEPKLVDGAILRCPVIAIHAESQPSRILQAIGSCARHVVPKLPAVAGNRGKNHHPEVQASVEKDHASDPLYYGGRIRVGTGLAILDAIKSVQSRLHEIETPYLLQHGTHDLVCHISGSEHLFHVTTRAKDRTFKVYADGHHDLPADPPRICDAYIHDFLEWIEAHT